MEVNAFLVAIAQPTVKWELMCDGMHREVRILFDLLVWAAGYVHLFAPGGY